MVVFLAPVMQVQWWLADGVCVLTTIESRLRGNPLAGRLEQETFVGRLLRPAVGEISRATVDHACTAIVWLMFTLCALRISLS